MKGKAPKSIEQHKRDGTLRARNKAKTPLIVGGRKKPACPKYITGHARMAFNEIVSDLWDSGILDYADRGLVKTAAQHCGIAITAQEQVDKFGIMYPVKRGARGGSAGYTVIEPNPAVKILRDALIEFRQCCDLLGIGPSARARLAGLGVKGRAPGKGIEAIGMLHALQGGKSD